MWKKYIFSLLLLYFTCVKCISEYTPTYIEETENFLVIEGIISEDSAFIKLSYSVGLLEGFTDDIYIYSAYVSVECSDGRFTNPAEWIEKGTYKIKTGKLNPEAQYRLSVRIGNKQYVSEYLSPMVTPEIKDVTREKKDKGHPIDIYVSAQGSLEQSRFYLWSYKEIWEIKAELFATEGWEEIDGMYKRVQYNIHTPLNKYYCWVRDESKTMLLGNTTRLSENIISSRINKILPTDERLSILYCIDVEQISLRKDAYDYFYNLQSNMESTGGLFSVMPTEMKGNLTCLTNPDEIVIGYIEVATKTNKSLYISVSEGLYESYSLSECPELILGYALPGYVYFGEGYAPNYCIDCRTRRNASKHRPASWPNDHY